MTPTSCPRRWPRWSARARARSREDGARIVLGIEGGGLSVAMACGMALALERLGLTAWLDAVYGTSSGSLMAAYVAGGGTADAERVLEDACTQGLREAHAARALAGRLASTT